METTPALPKRLSRLAGLARARLFWETYAPVFARAALALSAFLIATWLGAWEVLGDPVRLAAVAGVLYVLLRAVLTARKRRVPTRSDALRRLEDTAGLAHRPLDTLQDVAVLSPDLWPAHADAAREQAETITKVGRVPALTPIDRYQLRILVPLALGLALFLSLGVSGERLRRGLSPSWLPFTNPQALTFEAWIDPPAYTGRPPIYAARVDGTRSVLNAPVGSTLVVRASGASDLPRPRFDPEQGRARFLDTRPLGQTSLEVRTQVEGSGTLDWRIGWRRVAWTVEALPDAPPTLRITEPPEADKQDRLVVSFDADDDYGVESVVLEMVELTDDTDETTAFEIGEVITAQTDTGAFKSAEGRTLKLDLTRNPLAGRKVVGRLTAIDGAGQRGSSAPVYFTVPDKIFVEPLAKAIVEQRRLIVAGLSGDAGYTPPPKTRPDADASDGTFDTYQTQWRLGRAPEPLQRTAELIDAVTLYPDPSTFNDPVVYTALRHVGKSLRYARSTDALTGLPEHMWKLAIRAEFGTLGTALQEMQEAEAALREGIARRAPQREIDTLFERYNQAVDAYMEELRKNAKEADGEGGGSGPPMGSTDEIAELLKAIEEANARGDTEGARKALAQLAELLENMEIQLSQGGAGGEGGDPSDEISEEMAENIEDLAEQLADQRELEDQTRQAEREQQQGGQSGPSGNPPQPGEGQPQGEGEGEGAGQEDGDGPSPEQLAEQQAQIESLIEGLRERLAEGGDTPASGEGDDGERGGGQRDETGEGPGAGDERGERPGSGGEASKDGEGLGGTADRPGDTETGGGSGSALDRAQDAMRRSREALEGGDLAGSRLAQAEAIEALRDAAGALSREATQEAERRGGSEGDPLGRGIDGINSDNAEADIDERDNATRSREILEELRRRAAEAERDQQEQEYLDRLLDQY